MQMLLYRGPWFTLLYPEWWEWEVIEDVPAFFDPDGDGALQVAHFRQQAVIESLPELMKSWLHERHGLEAEVDQFSRFAVRAGGEAVACEFIRDERFWFATFLSLEGRLFLLLWNSEQAPDGETAPLLSQMIHSVQLPEWIEVEEGDVDAIEEGEWREQGDE